MGWAGVAIATPSLTQICPCSARSAMVETNIKYVINNSSK